MLPPPPAGYPHWMLAEIYEQPTTLQATLDAYLSGGNFRADTTGAVREWLRSQHQLVISASGSSRHAGLLAETNLEAVTNLPVDVEYASEYAYKHFHTPAQSGVLVISQSGETADTLGALRRARDQRQPTLAVTNVIGSTMDLEADVSMPTHAGKERAIPATKSFTAQLMVLELITTLAAEVRGTLGAGQVAKRLANVLELPAQVQAQLDRWRDEAAAMAQRAKAANSFLYLGRDLHFPVAREGALKLKESAYVHAEGYPAGELKHGPNALVSEGTPLVMIATVDPDREDSVRRHGKMVQLMTEMRQQGATIFALANEGDAKVADLADAVLTVAPAPEPVLAISEVVPLQMLAYYVATQRGVDVDRPRNLVKAVVAE
ncbi:MAG: SIS domain-containing protein [Acidobacteriota bacterium]|nr:SIS domain-containing protein [Acidobacteriota bacterium]